MKLIVLAALLFALCPPVGAGDVALMNGKIFTNNQKQQWASALLIHGDRIQLVGTNEEIQKATPSGARTIDLQQRVVIPGINDAHVHADEGLKFVDLPSDPNDPLGKPTFAELLEELKKAVQKVPEGQWIRGNLSTTIMEDPTANRWALDRVALRHPVWIENFAGHVTLVNSAALSALNISEDQKDFPGGIFGRRKEDGKLNGYLYEYARWVQMRKLASRDTAQDIQESFLKFSREAIQLGITSVQHFAMAYPAGKLYTTLREAPLPIRLRIVWFPMAEPQSFEKFPATPRLRVSGIKYILDGTPIERGAALEAPYSDLAGYRGLLDFGEGAAEMMDRADAAGEQLLLHCSGDRAANFVLSYISSHGGARKWSGKRVRIEHGDGLMPEKLKEASEAGVVVVPNPTHFAFPDLMKARYGPDRVQKMFPVRSLKENGVRFAIGSDGPINPFLNILFAITHPTNPKEAITVQDAVAAYTSGSAYAEFQEQEKGTLEPGKLADLAVLSQDIFSIPPQQLPATRSVLTVVGGEIVYEQSK